VAKQGFRARLLIDGMLVTGARGRRFSFEHEVEGESQEVVDLAVENIRRNILAGIGKKQSYILGTRILDLGAVVAVSVRRIGYGERGIRWRGSRGRV
jgi:hypothetical protein